MGTLKCIGRVTFIFLFLVLGAASAFAQFSSGVEGTVHDSAGAVVPGAKVTLTDTRLGVSKTATTNDAGYFRIDSIAASTYTLQIAESGFESYQENSLTLQVAELRTLSPVLKVGGTSTEVTVTASQTSLNLSAATTGSVISQETVSVTPLGGQNVYGLASLTPGITGSATNSTDNYTNEYAININAAGLRQEENGYQITTPTRIRHRMQAARPSHRTPRLFSQSIFGLTTLTQVKDGMGAPPSYADDQTGDPRGNRGGSGRGRSLHSFCKFEQPASHFALRQCRRGAIFVECSIVAYKRERDKLE